MKDPAQIPPITEPLYQTAGADVRVTPVMNGDDLRTGLRQGRRGLGERFARGGGRTLARK